MKKPQKSAIFASEAGYQIGASECRAVARKRASFKVRLDGNVARRSGLKLGITWDECLPGFGLRHRKGGARTWIVKFRYRGQPRFVTLGSTSELRVDAARAKARRLLVESSLVGLPQRPKQKQIPSFANYVAEFLADYGHHWKPSTLSSNVGYIERELVANFGKLALDQIARADVARWRDSLIERPGAFNRAVPVLAVMLNYAEQLGYRRKATNPCKGIARYKRVLPERFLSPGEYRRLGRTLATMEFANPNVPLAIWMLIYTGARSGEIANLRWREVRLLRLELEDSKTGPRTIYLNASAIAILAQIEPGGEDELVFDPGRARARIDPTQGWLRIRRHAALPDVRLHDLRHSFASAAISNGIPLATVGKLLGHVLPETTARYTHLADTLISETAERLCTGLASAFGLSHDQP